jgi:2,5-diketo-D-gluconate reductase A
MEHALARHFTRSIGVSNFDVAELDQVLGVASSPPAVDQVQFNPFAYRAALMHACERRGIALEAYSPLGTGAHLRDPTVVAIAERHGRTPAQVLMRWCVQRGVPVVAKSTHRERLAENARVFDFALSEDETARLDALDRTGRTDTALERKWWAS